MGAVFALTFPAGGAAGIGLAGADAFRDGGLLRRWLNGAPPARPAPPSRGSVLGEGGA